MQQNRAKTSEKISNRFSLAQQQKLKPYQFLPFSPGRSPKPLLGNLTTSTSNWSRKVRARKIASRQIEDHFEDQHTRYKNKENQHSSHFKIRTKKTNEPSSANNLQYFWFQKLYERQHNIRILHQQYLAEVAFELEKRPKESQTENYQTLQQKIIAQYNIIFEYKAEQLPNCLSP